MLELRRQLLASAEDKDPGGRFVRWFFSSAKDRCIFPGSSITNAEWVNNLLLTDPGVKEDWVKNTLGYFPAHPLLHIKLAGFEMRPKRADYLRSLGMAKLPRDAAVCLCAAAMLFDQKRPDLALKAVDQALLIDPNNPDARRLRNVYLKNLNPRQ
jgi:hypothetical protein